ncbi:MAG: aldehyde dehydrogenase family protein [Rhodothermia bacterium]|nr:MAG: aldehyde dehydrogenase family protein [Rhodothermia bacterium]
MGLRRYISFPRQLSMCQIHRSEESVTSPNSYQDLFELHSDAAAGLRLRGANERIERLRTLEVNLLAMQEEIGAALNNDFGKPYEEVLLTEISPVIIEIRHATRQLRQWMKPRRIQSPRLLAGSTSHVRFEAKGPSLIISPWNYAFTLTLGPIVSAVAAGCPVIVKPSEYTPAATDILTRLIVDTFPEDEVAVCPGGIDVSRTLLQLPFRHIFFTGSPDVGKKVMAAAAEHLASVTLELGGKSPAIVDETADLDSSAKRIVFGKFANGGQTCIAPDFLLVHESVADRLIQKLIFSIQSLYGENTTADTPSKDLSRVISTAHTVRLIKMLDEAVESGARVAYGGTYDLENRYIEPTLLCAVDHSARLMHDEIFGPILPIITFATNDQLIEGITGHAPPLSVYIFSRSKSFVSELTQSVEAGCISVNETLLHFSHPELPFGGLTTSGVGRGHGYAGFCAFSNEKAVFRQRFGPWLFSHVHPPYGENTKRWIRTLIRFS